MLNGLDPILIFNFSKLTPEATASISKIPVVSDIVQKIGLPPIPIYLSEKLTGLFIDTEDKNIDIDTKIESTADGDDPLTAQKPLGSTIKISMFGVKDSIGLVLLSSMCDLIVPKVTSQEYSITYLHGAITVFEGLLHSYTVQQVSENTLLMVNLEIAKTTEKTKKKPADPAVERVPEAANLESGTAPTKALKTPIKGPAPKPGVRTKPPINVNRGASGSF